MIFDGTPDLIEVDRSLHLLAAAITPYTRVRFPSIGVEIEVVQQSTQVVYFRHREDKPE